MAMRCWWAPVFCSKNPRVEHHPLPIQMQYYSTNRPLGTWQEQSVGNWTKHDKLREHMLTWLTHIYGWNEKDSLIIFDTIKIKNLLYIPCLDFYSSLTMKKSFSSTVSGKMIYSKSWKTVQPIYDRIHRHVCGPADFSDIKRLLQPNSLWSDDVNRYLTGTISKGSGCLPASFPHYTWKGPLRSMNRSYDYCICIDHMFLDIHRLPHKMNAKTRFSAGILCDNMELETFAHGITSCWTTPLGASKVLHRDDAFNHKAFTDFVTAIGSTFEPIPPRRHQKNVLESKHGVVRSIYLRLEESEPNMDTWILAVQSIDISNQLYGSNIMSAYEPGHGIPNPIAYQPLPIPDDIRHA